MNVAEKLKSLQACFPNNVLICMKDESGRILVQNHSCEAFCGKKTGEICKKNCMSHFDQNLEENPSAVRLRENERYEGRSFDLILSKSNKTIVSILLPTDTNLADQLERLKEAKLSPRELTIASLALQGLSNKGIAKELYISVETLRTHLRNIYRKTPPKVFPKRGQLNENTRCF